MAEIRQKARGTTSQLDAHVGAEGQLAIDLSRMEIRLFDGVAAGGKRFPHKDDNDSAYVRNAELTSAVAVKAINQGLATGDNVTFNTVDGRDVAVDGAKLDTIAPNAQVNVPTNLGVNVTSNNVTITSSTGSDVQIPVVTDTAGGIMSLSDKGKLDGVAAGAQVNVPTNLGFSVSGTLVTVTSSTGSNTDLPGATTTQAGVMIATDKVKLNGIAAGAQVNVGTNLANGGTGNARTITSSTGTGVTIPVATTSNAGYMSTDDKDKLNGLVKQADSLDTNAGRLLLVGAFGLGSETPQTDGSANALDNLGIISGEWRVLSAQVATVGGPVGASGGVVKQQAFGSANLAQVYSEVVAPGRQWQRHWASSTWTPWRLILTDTMVGFGESAGELLTNLDTHTVSGNFRAYGGAHPSATPGTNPFPTANASLSILHLSSTLGSASQYIVQYAVVQTDASQPLAIRARGGGAWGSWQYYVRETRQITAGFGLIGGGDLSADRGFAMPSGIGTVGSYAFVTRNGTELAPGATIAGSALLYAAIVATGIVGSGSALPGTWRIMGTMNVPAGTEARATVALRIS